MRQFPPFEKVVLEHIVQLLLALFEIAVAANAGNGLCRVQKSRDVIPPLTDYRMVLSWKIKIISFINR